MTIAVTTPTAAIDTTNTTVPLETPSPSLLSSPTARSDVAGFVGAGVVDGLMVVGLAVTVVLDDATVVDVDVDAVAVGVVGVTVVAAAG